MMALNAWDILLRLGAALASGFLFGLDRERLGRAAGLRTTILVCLAAALAMLLGEAFYHEGYAAAGGGWRPDPARLAAGIITGMGFIGAGVIVRQGMVTRGVTTAAVLWINTVLGLCYGGGYFLIGALGTGASLASLLLFRGLEGRMDRDWDGAVSVTAATDGVAVAEIKRALQAMSLTIRSLALTRDVADATLTVRFELRFRRSAARDLPEQVVSRLAALPGVRRVEWT